MIDRYKLPKDSLQTVLPRQAEALRQVPPSLLGVGAVEFLG